MNTQITEDYCNFEVAKLLKEKKFNGLCNAYYDCFTADNFHNGCEPTDFNSIDTKIRNIVSAPTHQMVMKWLREVHNLNIAILWDCGAYIGKNSFCYHIDRMDNYKDKGYNKIGFDSNEEACEEAIKYCLTNLI